MSDSSHRPALSAGCLAPDVAVLTTLSALTCPMLTPDGKPLFSSLRNGARLETTTEADVSWGNIRILDRFRQQARRSA